MTVIDSLIRLIQPFHKIDKRYAPNQFDVALEHHCNLIYDGILKDKECANRLSAICVEYINGDGHLPEYDLYILKQDSNYSRQLENIFREEDLYKQENLLRLFYVKLYRDLSEDFSNNTANIASTLLALQTFSLSKEGLPLMYLKDKLYLSKTSPKDLSTEIKRLYKYALFLAGNPNTDIKSLHLLNLVGCLLTNLYNISLHAEDRYNLASLISLLVTGE